MNPRGDAKRGDLHANIAFKSVVIKGTGKSEGN